MPLPRRAPSAASCEPIHHERACLIQSSYSNHPLGQPVAQLRGRKIASSEGDRVESGVWECSPGTWRRQVTKAEFCHFIAGRCSFTHEDGTRIEISAGDSVFFPAETRGIWDVKETVRKVYLVFEP